MFWKKRAEEKPIPSRIEVFARHCIDSKISRHKKRPAGFSREACYRNFLQTLDPAIVNVTFFLDCANGNPDDHFLSRERHYPVIRFQEGSEAGSFLRVLDVIAERTWSPDVVIYLLEDDYLHRPHWPRVLLEAFTIPEADYATLYDHRDKYFLPDYRKLTSRLFFTPSCHWRTTPSTTHTFATRPQTLLSDLACHKSFSQNRQISEDHAKFCSLGRQGRTLISSVPGWSTHAEPEFASPCTDWEHILGLSESKEELCPTRKP